MWVMRIAAIDCGTNTIHLIVGDLSPKGVQVVDHRVATPRLGRGLFRTGVIDSHASEDALRALHAFQERTAELGAERIVAVGTEALRFARNAQDFIDCVQALGVPLRIVTGQEEARLTFLAACHAAGVPGEVTLIDLGGGSTELVIGKGGVPTDWASLPFGSTYLTDRFADSGDLVGDVRAAVGEAILAAPEPRGMVVLTGGTANAVVGAVVADARRVAQEQGRERPSGVVQVDARDFLLLLDLHISSREEDLAAMPWVEPERAKVLRAGAIALDVLCDRPTVKRVTVTPFGLCLGLLLDTGPVSEESSRG